LGSPEGKDGNRLAPPLIENQRLLGSASSTVSLYKPCDFATFSASRRTHPVDYIAENQVKQKPTTKEKQNTLTSTSARLVKMLTRNSGTQGNILTLVEKRTRVQSLPNQTVDQTVR
jgi:hypothetical protein